MVRERGAADPTADTVDVYVNRVLFQDNFAFRTATPFVDVLAGVHLNIGVAPSHSDGPGDVISDFNVVLGYTAQELDGEMKGGIGKPQWRRRS